jgi:hypothetical protein
MLSVINAGCRYAGYLYGRKSFCWLSDFMLIGFMPSVRLSIIMLSVIMLSVEVPLWKFNFFNIKDWYHVCD